MDTISVLRRKASLLDDPHQLLRTNFRLPSMEQLYAEIAADCTTPSQPTTSGKLFLSTRTLCFASSDSRCVFVLPLSAVRRVERIQHRHTQFAISVTTWHNTTTHIALLGLRYSAEQFCDTLKIRLRAQSTCISSLQPFLATCWSEFLLERKDSQPPGGLGIVYGFPGNAKRQRDKAKMRLWAEYLRDNGRNLTLIRVPTFQKLIRVGLSNRLRGEVWELCSGSMYARFFSSSTYQQLLSQNATNQSIALEEIEKDLSRSLPEYPAYQTEEGIERLRRVLVAYSWKNPELGYCQAMNIVVAAMLIYTTEEQAFFLLTNMIESMLPGYYSTTMYGTLLDQRVFESLLEKTMPILWDHFAKQDMQMSVVSLPWFLSLYINSMPLEFAVRVLDCFFLEGPRVLFQIGLAILRVNGEALLDITDDGHFISHLKNYFSTLSHSAHPSSSNPRLRAITKFQDLLVVAFKEFSVITTAMITAQRDKYRSQVMDGIESFAKRTTLRNLQNPGKLPAAQLGVIYDRYHTAVFANPVLSTSTNRMQFDTFITFLTGIASWMDSETLHPFLTRLFRKWDSEEEGTLSLQDVVSGLGQLVKPDLMSLMSYFFETHDTNSKGSLSKEEQINVSESLLFLTRKEQNLDDFLSCVSSFIQNAHKYADQDGSLSLPSFRMIILSSPVLERYFTDGFRNTIVLTPPPAPPPAKSMMRVLISGLVNDSIWVAGEVRRRIELEVADEENSYTVGSVREGDRDVLLEGVT